MDIDHIFLRARRNAPEGDALRAFGLAEGSGNRHPGQGTANRRFFVHNAFIELLWIEDEAEANGVATTPTQLADRLRPDAADVSPFGVCFRPSHAHDTAPFPMWQYAPAYLPAGMTVGIGRDVPLAEPMWFFLAQGTPPHAAPAARRQPLDHPAGLVELTGVAITVAGDAAPSAPAVAALESGRVAIATGSAPLMALTFDGGRGGRHHDFRPALPLVIHY
jgi:hypothetical protein